MLSLQDKVIIVTGAGVGIGKATALVLRDLGATVVATVNRNVDADLEAAATETFLIEKVDVTDSAAVTALIESTLARFGRIDGMVNNAGILIPGTILDASEEDYAKTFDVNVKGVFLGCKAVLPSMLAAGGGSIVNIASINSYGAEQNLALYTASKGAVLQLTKAIALDHASQGIRANAICPGFVDTKLNEPHWGLSGTREDLMSGLPDFQPIGRDIAPEEIGYSVAFLLSDLSKAITGTGYVVDGGVLCKA